MRRARCRSLRGRGSHGPEEGHGRVERPRTLGNASLRRRHAHHPESPCRQCRYILLRFVYNDDTFN